MTFKLACGDVMPGCSSQFESTDRDTLMAQVGAHAASAHGITDVTPEIFEAIDSRIAVSA